jgi:two-component system response regulator FixJ
VDSDPAVRDGLHYLLRLLDLNVECFGSAEGLLNLPKLADKACVVTEVHLPGMTGLELLEELESRAVKVPVIVLASRADVPTAVRALRRGAVDFIEKPFVDRVLTQRIREALGLTDPRDRPSDLAGSRSRSAS